MIGLSVLTLLLLTTSSAANTCEEERDVDVIFEVPELGRNESLREARKFISILAEKAAHSCWRPRIRVAGSEVYHINSFDCYTVECVEEGAAKLNAELERSEINAKENVMLALNDMKKEAFESDVIPGLVGPRRVVLLILSSKPRDDVILPGLINELLEGGYDFIAVGVGEGQNEPLERIAAQQNRVVILDRFSQLNTDDEENKNEQILSILDDPEKPDTTETPILEDFVRGGYRYTDKCEFIADIVFLIDSSGSVQQRTDYELLKKFVIKISSSFNISKHAARVSAIVFSDRQPYTRVTVKLDDHFTREGFENAIMRSPYMGYRTRIDLALQLARDTVFTKENGARGDTSKIVFLLTDGKQNPVKTYDPLKVSRDMMKDGVKIFAVGITNNVDQEQLESIAGEAERVFYIDDFDELGNNVFLKKVATAGCRAGSLPPEVVVTARPTTTSTTTTPPPSTADPTGCDLPDDKGCARYKDAKDSYCVRNWLKVNCKYMCGICKYKDDSCEIEDKAQCAQYEVGKESYCTQPWMQNNCKYMCGVCVDESAATTEPPIIEPDTGGNSTGGVGTCSSCCHGHNVYLNIFRGGSGPNYVMQGMKLKPAGGSLTGVAPTKGPAIQITEEGKQITMKQLIKIVQQFMPGKPKLVKTIQQFVTAEKQMLAKELPTHVIGVPSMVARTQRVDRIPGEKKRRRRSVDVIDAAKVKINKIAGNAGCKLFLSALKEHGILQQIDNLLKDKKDVIIFCPIDAAFERIYRAKLPLEEEKDILLNHIAVKHDIHGTMYKTLLPGGRIVLNPTSKNGKVTWTANGIELILALTDGMSREVILTKDVIYPKTHGMIEVLKSNANISMFYELFRMSSMSEIFKSKELTKVCFTKDTCVRLSRSMQKHMKEAISFNEFTIIAPTNTMFDGMKKAKLKSLMKDPKARLDFLQEHIFLGSLADSDDHHRGIAYSVSPFHSVLMMNNERKERFLVHSDKRLLLVKQDIPVSQGTLYIVEMLD